MEFRVYDGKAERENGIPTCRNSAHIVVGRQGSEHRPVWASGTRGPRRWPVPCVRPKQKADLNPLLSRKVTSLSPFY
ncbi:hypothetical protein E2C01_035056 [Portunus trituberculatus]|uniref:Uncharacterized protein n=1 Tax=Portunus trituberculatus TaxID=210409 RepID=A0A5B7FAF4_PORTR|nr:hypothetical protein [Portunus trituberculatus]